MISWMQKHNKYLVWTIWIATIAFIGAGFVGWGSYQFGGKAGNVAKVGNIEIKQSKLNMVYSNLYSRYNEMLQGQLDEKKAKELGLVQQAFETIKTQAILLNYAKDLGIIVSDEEVAHTLESIKGFQNKDGVFDRNAYNMYLTSQRLKAKTFEDTLRDELTITKLLDLLHIPALPLEKEVITAAMGVSDKIAYKVLSEKDVNITIDDNALKTYWEKHKEAFKTPKRYTLEILWTPSNETPVTDEEIKSFYDTNSFNYINASGKQLTLADAKAQVVKDLKLKKTKKTAQKAYIAFKKGKLDKSAIMSTTLPLNDPTLSTEVWNTLQQRKEGDILKPKIVNDKYATVKIIAVTQPQIMSFEEAKPLVTKQYEAEAKQEALASLAESTLKTISETNATVSDYLSLGKFDNLETLNSQESLQFLQKLFTSSKEKGIISVANKVIVYSIISQKQQPLDEAQQKRVESTVNTIKQRVFESNLIKVLERKYPTEVYMGGLTN